MDIIDIIDKADKAILEYNKGELRWDSNYKWFKIKREFAKDLYEYYEVSDNPKKDRCFTLAEHISADNSFASIASVFNSLVDLIK